jgi:hypothetical protein
VFLNVYELIDLLLVDRKMVSQFFDKHYLILYDEKYLEIKLPLLNCKNYTRYLYIYNFFLYSIISNPISGYFLI